METARELDKKGWPVMYIENLFWDNDIDFVPKHKPSDFRHPCDGELKPEELTY